MKSCVLVQQRLFHDEATRIFALVEYPIGGEPEADYPIHISDLSSADGKIQITSSESVIEPGEPALRLEIEEAVYFEMNCHYAGITKKGEILEKIPAEEDKVLGMYTNAFERIMKVGAVKPFIKGTATVFEMACNDRLAAINSKQGAYLKDLSTDLIKAVEAPPQQKSIRTCYSEYRTQLRRCDSIRSRTIERCRARYPLVVAKNTTRIVYKQSRGQYYVCIVRANLEFLRYTWNSLQAKRK